MLLESPTRYELQQLVTELNALYAELIDDDRLEEWPDLFVSDCVYTVIARENFDRQMDTSAIYCDSRGMLADRIVSLRKANIFPVHAYRHILGPTRIVSATGTLAKSHTSYAVLMTRTDGRTTIYNSGKYIDEIDLSGERPLFRSKIAVFDTNLIDTMMVRPI
ncbi:MULTISPECIES: aromatic-ring-hydroxylating dioxygenase subunit beta [Sphingomonadales]|uniref:Anthranilate 1,2-dioxygenase n=3 Tax=Sphingomonadales TaxID=204457 RepID=A0A0G3XN69_9SPHN|nr:MULTISPECIES: aromatic-ring-hydroxylating dioxygenase subunit beta [Sphingomonadales]EZP70118.1 putative small subunit of oxygenase [Sphingomonas paucimobilis]AIT82631.1 anthranilate 1,2-dioxygenase [Novosphingobium pentaromativorans US6-1]AKM12069.1 anthranilate 1,2-dioxygenase [Croceicoccus naphthovorans]EHJ58009.1 putative small subunit of oxygenase [Novosphingobium pentaromativorans US6-1]MBB3992061.1 anthranilate 1,2-dioxygenase small subunit [Croceicoccus naphthovorans]